MLRENAAASELPWTVGSRESAKEGFDFEFQSRLQLNDRLDGIWFCQDLLCEQRERNNAAVRLRGRNRKTTFRQTGKTLTRKTAEMSYTATSRETVLTVSVPIGFESRFHFRGAGSPAETSECLHSEAPTEPTGETAAPNTLNSRKTKRWLRW